MHFSTSAFVAPVLGSILLSLGVGCVATRPQEADIRWVSVAESRSRFAVEEASMERWQPGIAGALGDTEYTLQIRVLAGPEVSFPHLYFRGREMALTPMHPPGRVSAQPPPNRFAAGQQARLHASASAAVPTKALHSWMTKTPETAVLSIESEGQVSYLSLPSFTVKNQPNRP